MEASCPSLFQLLINMYLQLQFITFKIYMKSASSQVFEHKVFPKSGNWLRICQFIDQSYSWGCIQLGYRHILNYAQAVLG